METDVNDKMHQIAEGTRVQWSTEEELTSTRTNCNQICIWCIVFSLLLLLYFRAPVS